MDDEKRHPIDGVCTPMGMSEMVERASERCRQTHTEYQDSCHFCRFDKAIIDAITKGNDHG